ncbi:MAG TPA: hypothetical protein VGI17_07595 [Solirubrobacterales bacterium]|jgi:hypothetical protein
MTENQAYVLLFSICISAELACYFLLRALGADEETVIFAALMCLVVGALTVGGIGVHYDEKEVERGKHRED